MDRPRLLDLCCGAGGCSAGYARAGFDVTGLDIEWQPNYPYRFIRGDLLDVEPAEVKRHYDVVVASPPCQAYSRMHGSTGPDLIALTRDLLERTGLPYVIENVPGAPLHNPVVLCGSMFGLDVRRHRLFETNWPILVPPCTHGYQAAEKYDLYDHGKAYRSGIVHAFGSGGGKAAEHWAEAMGIDWMTRDEMTQAIPPAYTKFIGDQLLSQLRRAA